MAVQVLLVILLTVFGLFVLSRARRTHQLCWMHRQAEKITTEERQNHRFASLDDFLSSPEIRDQILREMEGKNELELALLDQDGRALDKYGVLDGILSCIGEEDFTPKDRFQVAVVLREGKVLVRKIYGNNRAAFIHEWFYLALLQNIANVPAVWAAEQDHNMLLMNFIPGRSMQEILSNTGAQLRYSDIHDDPALQKLSEKKRQAKLDARARRWMPKVFGEEFLSQLDEQLDAIHQTGAVGVIVKPGNVIVSQENKPHLVDFHMLSYQPRKSLIFHLLRDRDRMTYARRVGRDLITERSVREKIGALNGHVYAPIDFGVGLILGQFWSITSGMGRWEVFIQNGMPDLKGKRVLDLGSNNGCMPLMMLRAGAREVVGVELSKTYYQQALLVHRLFEWRDLRRYKFHLHLGNMLDILDEDWGAFDVVTTLCTLYYLKDRDMVQIVRRAAELAPIMVIQANRKASSKTDPDKSRRASDWFLKELLKNNGFPNVTLYAPEGTT